MTEFDNHLIWETYGNSLRIMANHIASEKNMGLPYCTNHCALLKDVQLCTTQTPNSENARSSEFSYCSCEQDQELHKHCSILLAGRNNTLPHVPHDHASREDLAPAQLPRCPANPIELAHTTKVPILTLTLTLTLAP